MHTAWHNRGFFYATGRRPDQHQKTGKISYFPAPAGNRFFYAPGASKMSKYFKNFETVSFRPFAMAESEGSQGGSQLPVQDDADNESSVLQPGGAEKSRHVVKKRTPAEMLDETRQVLAK